ncbi:MULTISPECIES: hypothetical protein [Bacillus]|uniref:Uncharacterized protein n=1 Tax=Bacillus capparidis TaxID=1840411 RepID=A0ABS4CTD7_9BACI|nr:MULTISPECIES: hypothetical protein [Bacillus]MBP1080844.1 hypothetical protein [Bacillus capparidis]MED1097487.1 hypothetical protein [Bacillus capparidis]
MKVNVIKGPRFEQVQELAYRHLAKLLAEKYSDVPKKKEVG